MRPISLTIEGINSYRGVQTIDFSELTSYGLFGIFGPTGSGKSTILDAITLALYARLPRSTKNFVNINEKKASVVFTFSISAETTKTYQVSRSFRYQGKEGAKTVHNTSAKLICLSGQEPQVIKDLPTEVTQACVDLLGLNSDDFMRTVVLPQGQFSEFMKLKNRERRGMLQRIFHLEEYGEDLNRKLSAARIKQELAISNLEGELKSYQDVTEEAINKSRDQLTLSKASYEKGSQEQKALSDHFKELSDIRDLLNEYEPLAKEHGNLLSRQEKNEEEKALLDRARRAGQLKPILDQAEKAKNQHRLITAQLEELRNRQAAVRESFDSLNRQKETFLAEYTRRLPQLTLANQQLSMALKLAEAIANCQKKKAEADKAWSEANKRQKKLAREKEKIFQEEEARKRDLALLDKELESLRTDPLRRAELERGHILEEQYRQKRSHYDKLSQTASEDKRLLEKSQNRHSDILRQAAGLQTYGACRQKDLEKQGRQMEEALSMLIEDREKNDSLLEACRTNHMASILRASLKDGDICPVCGQVHHTDRDSGHLTKGPASQDSPDQSAAEARRKAEAVKDRNDLIRQYEEKQKKLGDKELKLRTDQSRLSQSQEILANDLEALKKILPEKKDFPASDGPGLAGADAGQFSGQEELSRQIRSILERQSSSQAELKTRQDTFHRSHQAQKEMYKELSRTLEEIRSLRTHLKVDSCSKALEEIRKKERQEQDVQEKIQKSRAAFEELETRKGSLLELIASTDIEVEGAAREVSSYEAIIQEQAGQFPAGISPQDDHQALLEQKLREQKDLEEEKTRLESSTEQLESQNQQLKSQVLAMTSRQEEAAGHEAEAFALAEKQARALGFDDASSPRDWYLTDEKIKEKEAAIEEYLNKLAHTSERLKYLEEKLAGRSCSRQEWEEAGAELSRITELNEELASRITVLNHQIESLTSRYEKKQALNSELKAASHRQDLINELSRLFKGNTFIEFMAESRLKYIAIEASRILSDISGGDYSLEVNDATEFVIRDNKNGGNLRPSDTLSGGETFITSLALALSLSSTIQLNGRASLELFFLDEGFGSLDSDLLEVVMTSLEHLQTRKRSIGIITHVDAVRSRVPVKLNVIPAEEGEEGSRIVMEYS
ncbi:MAG: SMC family ATPase [Eubacterium sp.]|nr:SMC family ATPase [Eubacterium sp.]